MNVFFPRGKWTRLSCGGGSLGGNSSVFRTLGNPVYLYLAGFSPSTTSGVGGGTKAVWSLKSNTIQLLYSVLAWIRIKQDLSSTMYSRFDGINTQ